MLPCTQWPVFGDSPPPEITPFVNVSLHGYLRQNPESDPYSQLALTSGLSKPPSYFAFLEAIQTLTLPLQSVKHVGSGSSKDVLPHILETDPADLLLSDAPLYDTLAIALKSQKTDGTLVVLVEDTVSLSATQVTYLLCACYKTVQLLPLVASGSTGLKLLVCAGFLNSVATCPTSPPYDIQLSSYFLTHLEEINSILGQGRLEYARSRESKYVDWCRTYVKPPENELTS